MGGSLLPRWGETFPTVAGMSGNGGKGSSGPLAEFLRARRARVRPAEQGLVPGGERQVPGLRRDEVALLAGISTDYYVRLEQGRERRPSGPVLSALAEALLLEEPARRHLRELAAAGRADDGEDTGEAELPAARLEALRPLLDALAVPALVIDRQLDVVAANPLGALLYEGLEHRDNYARMVFLSPGAGEFFVDRAETAACVVASLRASAGARPSARLERLVGELALYSDEFAEAWAAHRVYEKTVDRKRFRHPMVGHVVFDQHVLELPAGAGHRIWAYHPSDAPTAQALVRLRDLTTLTAPAQDEALRERRP